MNKIHFNVDECSSSVGTGIIIYALYVGFEFIGGQEVFGTIQRKNKKSF